MKTIITTLVAGLAISVALGSENETQAQDIRSFVNGAVNVLQQNRGSIQRQANFAYQQTAERQHAGRHGHWIPRPPCTPNYCPPPPPRVCYVYLVYYYDCHCGWKFYGEYHDRFAASHAVSRLQHQGYRAYMRQAAR